MDLHVGTLQPYITCLDIGNRYTNFLYQIHMKFLGNTWAGIVFRATGLWAQHCHSYWLQSGQCFSRDNE
jgi:hypothetical protein